MRYMGAKISVISTAFAVILMAGLFSPAWAGAWNLPKNKGQIIITSQFSDGSRIFDDNGKAAVPVDYSKQDSRLFIEHGLAKKWTLVGSASYQQLTFRGPDSAINFDGFDDAFLGVRYQIARRQGLAVALQGGFINAAGPRDNRLDISGRKDQLELRALYGRSWEHGWGDVFIDTQIGGRLKTDGGYHSTVFDVTAGYKPNKKWMFMGQAFSAKRERESRGGFTAPQRAQVKASGSIVFQTSEKSRVQIGYERSLAGRNVVREQGIILSTWVSY